MKAVRSVLFGVEDWAAGITGWVVTLGVLIVHFPRAVLNGLARGIADGVRRVGE